MVGCPPGGLITSRSSSERDGLSGWPAGPGGPAGPAGPVAPCAPVATFSVTVFVGGGAELPAVSAAAANPPAARKAAPPTASPKVLLLTGLDPPHFQAVKFLGQSLCLGPRVSEPLYTRIFVLLAAFPYRPNGGYDPTYG